MSDVTFRLDTLGRPAASEANAAVSLTFDPSLSLRRAAWLARQMADRLAAQAGKAEREARAVERTQPAEP
jgi:hypothetical protein